MNIILTCSRNDNLPELCKEQFGEDKVEVLKRHGELGLQEIEVIITGIEAVIAAASFLYTVLSDKKKKNLTENMRK